MDCSRRYGIVAEIRDRKVNMESRAMEYCTTRRDRLAGVANFAELHVGQLVFSAYDCRRHEIA